MADPNYHEHWPRSRDGRCKQIIGHSICGLPADAPGHVRWATRAAEAEADARARRINDIEPLMRDILETLADDTWDPDSDAADGGISALDVLRQEAKRVLERL